MTADDSDNQTDEQIVAQVVAGNTDAFRILFERYHSKAFGLAFGMTGRTDLADDLVQEIFISVFKGLNGFRSEAKFGTWFYRIATNCSLNFIRRPWWRRGQSIDEPEARQVQAVDDIEKEVRIREIQQDVRRALLSLKPHLRAVVVLGDIDGLTHKEIAEALQLKLGTVESRLHRARKLLARKLKHLKGQI